MSATDTFEELDPQLLEALGRSVPCDHDAELPLYNIGGRWCCGRCVGQARHEHEADVQTWRIREAFPLTYAPELIERARGFALTPAEHNQVRSHPSRWLRRYGLAGLIS